MKKIIVLLLFMGVGFISCQESDPKIEIVSPEQVYEAIQGDASIQLVDVRTQNEYQVNHLKKAQNICITNKDFKEKVAQLDKKNPFMCIVLKGGEALKLLKS